MLILEIIEGIDNKTIGLSWLWINQIWWRSLSVTYLILYLLIRYSGFILMKWHLTTDTMLMNSNKIFPWYTLWGFKLSWTWGKLVSLHCFLYCWHPSARCGLKGGHFHMDTCIYTHWSLQQRSLKKVAWPKITANSHTEYVNKISADWLNQEPIC